MCTCIGAFTKDCENMLNIIICMLLLKTFCVLFSDGGIFCSMHRLQTHFWEFVLVVTYEVGVKANTIAFLKLIFSLTHLFIAKKTWVIWSLDISPLTEMWNLLVIDNDISVKGSYCSSKIMPHSRQKKKIRKSFFAF